MSQQFVSVPVPTERVAEVYKLLSSPPRHISPSDNASQTTQVDEWNWLQKHTNEKIEWPIDTVQRAVTESNTAQRAMLKHLANHPGEWLTTQQIADEVGVKRSDIAGALSGLARRAKSRYGQHHGSQRWFFAMQWDGAQSSYRMDEREAVIVRELFEK